MATPRQFKIDRARFTHKYEVVPQDAGNSTTMAVDISVYTPGKADLTLHDGPEFSNPVVAVAHMPKLTANMKFGIGDPGKAPEGVHWEDLKNDSYLGGVYTFEWASPTKLEAPNAAARKRYTWKRTHSVAVDGAKPQKGSLRNYKLIGDGGDDDVVAVFSYDLAWASIGKLQINVDNGRDFDLAILITILSIEEKLRRRSHRGKGGGGGGGSG